MEGRKFSLRSQCLLLGHLSPDLLESRCPTQPPPPILCTSARPQPHARGTTQRPTFSGRDCDHVSPEDPKIGVLGQR